MRGKKTKILPFLWMVAQRRYGFSIPGDAQNSAEHNLEQPGLSLRSNFEAVPALKRGLDQVILKGPSQLKLI